MIETDFIHLDTDILNIVGGHVKQDNIDGMANFFFEYVDNLLKK
jgi:hypothetical protein